jgi:hypothetical protein
MAEEIDLKEVDRRLVARMVRKGDVSEREVEKALKQLPDVADKAAPVDTKLGTDED